MKDCFFKNGQDECEKHKSDLKHSNRLMGKKESQLQTGSIVSSTTPIKCKQEIWVIYKYNGKWCSG